MVFVWIFLDVVMHTKTLLFSWLYCFVLNIWYISYMLSCSLWAENIFSGLRSPHLVKNFWYNNYVNAVKQIFRKPDRNRILKPDIRPEPDSAGYLDIRSVPKSGVWETHVLGWGSGSLSMFFLLICGNVWVYYVGLVVDTKTLLLWFCKVIWSWKHWHIVAWSFIFICIFIQVIVSFIPSWCNASVWNMIVVEIYIVTLLFIQWLFVR